MGLRQMLRNASLGWRVLFFCDHKVGIDGVRSDPAKVKVVLGGLPNPCERVAMFSWLYGVVLTVYSLICRDRAFSDSTVEFW